MATLVTMHSDGQQTRTPVFKSLTTIGSDPDSDVHLREPGVARVAAHIAYDGRTFTIATTDKRQEIQVSGKTVRKQTLVDGDEVVIGCVRMRFALEDTPAVAPEAVDPGHSRELEAYRRLLSFSRALGGKKDVQGLLEVLLDEIVALTRAAKGFLVLVEEGTLHVKVARNLRGETLDEAVEALSDTILAKVMRTHQPLVVSDALNDTEFNSSLSVVNLKLTSVMCAPLLHQGELFGAIYVGNNSVVNLFDETSLELLTIFCGQASLLVQNALHVSALTVEKDELKGKLEKSRYGEIIGACDGMRQVYSRIEKVARADVSVLITGETGTGKELIANEIHRRSPRKDGPFIVINCGAIPEHLLESELFGHVRGAFTGAVQTREGKFQAAQGGTLFLDEIGEMPLQLQVKILRALQERQVTKVGEHKAEHVDIRVLTATHRDLEKMVRKGTFREDLYYRLNVVQLPLPPLRDRGDDVLVLSTYLLNKFNEEYGAKVKGFSPKAVTAMRKYTWPGNVRQLENRIKRAIVLAEGGRVTPEDLDIHDDDLEEILPLAEALERYRRRYINQTLERNGDNRTKTAKELGVDPRTIFRHLESERDPEKDPVV
jgi:transcriptional regulator with GAF, ATPase, and Fis domain